MFTKLKDPPRERTPTQVARETKLPERKLRTAAEIKKASPTLAQNGTRRPAAAVIVPTW